MKQKVTKMAMKKAVPVKAKKATAKFTPAINKVTGVKMLDKAMKSKKKPNYKVPKTPKNSGMGWGG